MAKIKHKAVKKTANLARNPKYQSVAAVIIVLAAAILGYLLFSASHAASPFVSSEAEGGTLSGAATTVSGDSTASGNSYVRFGALPSSSGSGTTTLLRGMYNTPSSLNASIDAGSTYTCGNCGGWAGISGYSPPSPSSWNKWLLLGVNMEPDGDTNSQVPSNTGTFKTLAQNLVNAGWSNAILRIGWEWSGNWYAWSNNTTPAQYVTAFDDIVTAMRSVSGQHFLFDWCDNGGSSPTSGSWSSWYPGDSYVDIIGVDHYEDQNNNASQANTNWNNDLNATGGLQYVANFAAQHHKYMSVPEWGVNGNNDGTFINLMSSFVHNSANNVYYESYFNYTGPNADDMLQDLPNAMSAYQNDFSS